MRAGFGKAELTPPLGVELAGYGYYLQRRAAAVADPLYARALLLEQGEQRALLVSCEVLGLSRPVCDAVIRHAREALGCAEAAVTIVSVHTHTGPAIQYHEGCGEVNEAYVGGVAGKICQALDAAAEDLARVQSLSLVSRPLEGDFVYNRAAADGPVDRLLRGFVLRRDAKRPIALLSAACHGVFRGRVPLVSADFAGAVNHLAEERGYAPLYLNGLCGDIDPWNPSPERMEGFARQIASLLDAEGKPLPLAFQAGNIPFTLYHPSVSLAEIHAAAADAVRRAGGETAPAARVARAWERKMAKRAHALPTEEALKASYLLLGGVPILALPFEGFTRIGMDIRRKLGRQDALVLGCAEELMGYLPTRDDLARGAYAALESTFLYGRLPVLAGEAERLGEELGEALERRML